MSSWYIEFGPSMMTLSTVARTIGFSIRCVAHGVLEFTTAFNSSLYIWLFFWINSFRDYLYFVSSLGQAVVITIVVIAGTVITTGSIGHHLQVMLFTDGLYISIIHILPSQTDTAHTPVLFVVLPKRFRNYSSFYTVLFLYRTYGTPLLWCAFFPGLKPRARFGRAYSIKITTFTLLLDNSS